MYLVIASGSSPKSSREEEEIMNDTRIYLIIHEELERKGGNISG